MCNVLSFSQESTKERPGTSRMVPGLSRRLKGHILTFPYSCIANIAPLESPVVQIFLCPFGNPGGAGIIHYPFRIIHSLKSGLQYEWFAAMIILYNV